MGRCRCLSVLSLHVFLLSLLDLPMTRTTTTGESIQLPGPLSGLRGSLLQARAAAAVAAAFAGGDDGRDPALLKIGPTVSRSHVRLFKTARLRCFPDLARTSAVRALYWLPSHERDRSTKREF